VPQSVRDWLSSTEADLEFTYDVQPLKILLSIREDYLADLESLNQKIPSLLKNGRVHLQPMDGLQACAAIERPSNSDGSQIISSRISHKVIEHIGVKRLPLRFDKVDSWDRSDLHNWEVEPFLLSIVCRELNEKRLSTNSKQITEEMLSDLQGDILSSFYSHGLEGTSDAVRLFIEDELVGPSGQRELVALQSAIDDRRILREELDQLVERRLLRYEEDRNRVVRVELSHDRLVQVVKASKSKRIEDKKRRQRNIYYGGALFLCLIAVIALWARVSQDRVKSEAVRCTMKTGPIESQYAGSKGEFTLRTGLPETRESAVVTVKFDNSVVGLEWELTVEPEEYLKSCHVQHEIESIDEVTMRIPPEVKLITLNGLRHGLLYTYSAFAKISMLPSLISNDLVTIAVIEVGDRKIQSAGDFSEPLRISTLSTNVNITMRAQEASQPNEARAVYMHFDNRKKLLLAKHISSAKYSFESLPLEHNKVTECAIYAQNLQSGILHSHKFQLLLDTVKPIIKSVTWSKPISNGYFEIKTGSELDVTIATDEPLSRAEVVASGNHVKLAPVDSSPREWSGNLGVLNIGEGSHSVGFVLTDVVGNVTDEHRVITVNSSGPRFDLPGLGEGPMQESYVLSGNSKIRLTLEDGNGIAEARLRSDPPILDIPASVGGRNLASIAITMPDVRKTWTGTFNLFGSDKLGLTSNRNITVTIQPRNRWGEIVEWRGFKWCLVTGTNGVYITKTEVSNKQYINIGGTPRPRLWPVIGLPEYSDRNGNAIRGEDFPVVGLTPDEILSVREKLGARLPTYQEWIRAAWAQNPNGRYPWNDRAESKYRKFCNYYINSELDKHIVVSSFVVFPGLSIKRLSLRFATVSIDPMAVAAVPSTNTGAATSSNLEAATSVVLDHSTHEVTDGTPGGSNNVAVFENIVGNVAELVYDGDTSSGRYLVVGGHFDNTYEELNLFTCRQVYRAEQHGIGAGSYRVGFRLAIDVNDDETDPEFRRLAGAAQ
jgi:hypothetical protein